MIFHAKIGALRENLYVSHTLFILYLEGNHTLFGEKLNHNESGTNCRG